MTTKFAPVFGSMAALMLLAACGSQSTEAPKEQVNPNAAFGDAEMAAENGAIAIPDTETVPEADVVPEVEAVPES